MCILIIGSVSGQLEGSYSVVHSKSPAGGSRIVAPVTIIARSQNKVMLTWAPFKGAVSHYVLERSVDGKNYHEAGVFFTGEWDNEPDYRYTDKLRKPYAGVLFYRLRIVGQDGSELSTIPVICEPAQ